MFYKLVLFSFFSFTYLYSVHSKTNSELEDEWQLFKYNYSKVYESEKEERFRFSVFADNWRKVERHNSEASLGLKSYTLKINKFSDLLIHEITSIYKGYKPKANNRSIGLKFRRNESLVLPDSVDWRNEGAVTPVKNQGDCGSCWTFSVVGALEGQHFRKTGKLVSLSEQQLVDCVSSNGCGGGHIHDAYNYIKDNHGIDTEDSYPYTAKNGKCKYNPKNVGATITGYVDIESGNEEALKEAVATIGPISVVIDPLSTAFCYYHTGIFYEPNCSIDYLVHAVLVVGYGTTEDGKDYWIVKNSDGEDWGDTGYILMSRNMNNNCGIASNASYPLV